MKDNFCILIAFVAATLCCQSQSISVAGTILEDAVWSADTVLVTDDLFVPDTVRLTIEPGVIVLVSRRKAIRVRGALVAQGSMEAPIRFSARDTLYNSDTTSFLGTWEGLHFLDMNSHNDSSILDYCILEHGGAYGPAHIDRYGGGIFVRNSSNIRISNSVIRNNYAQWGGGGIYLTENSSILIKDNIIRNNACGNEGGGIMSGEGCSPRITGNLIIENLATKFVQAFPGFYGYNGRGGGVCISTLTEERPPQVIGNVVCNNFSSSGGGIYESSFETHIVSNIVANNRGTGLFIGVSISGSYVLNNTVCNNLGIGISGLLSNNLSIRNNIFHNNQHHYLQVLVDTMDILYDMDMPERVFSYNNVGTASDDLGPNTIANLVPIGEGNISTLPQFVGGSAGAGLAYSGYEADWRLAMGDAGIDAGNAADVLDILPETDVYGGDRIQGMAIDMGAVEYDPTVSVATPSKEESAVGIYPNPFSGQVWIELKNALPTNWDLLIWNEQGQLIASHQLSGSLVGLPTNGFAAGVYFFEGKSKDGQRLFMRKMVKGK